MLYTILNLEGKLESKWSLNPETDFAGLQVLGETLKDADGNYESDEWLSLDRDGRPTIDSGKKAAVLKAVVDSRDLLKAQLNDRAVAKDRLRKIDFTQVTTIASLKEILKDFLIALGK